MNRELRPVSLIEMLQKPAEVFAGLMPLPRSLYAGIIPQAVARSLMPPNRLSLLEKKPSVSR